MAMKRRDVIAMLGGAAAAWPLAARAQQPKVLTIGILPVAGIGSEQFMRLFREDMQELGYTEGQNIRYEFRSDQVSRLPDLAAELVALKPDIIVTYGQPASIAATQATNDIPIVIALAANPESLARPGGNVTGVSAKGAELAGKCVELIREMLPSAHRVVVLANAPDPFSKPMLEQIRLAGTATGMAIDAIMIHNAEELDAAFPAMEKDRPDAVFIQPSLPPKRGAELALKYRIPAVSTGPVAEEGGLMTYSIVVADAYRRAAVFVDKILKGAKPADLPVEQVARFELVINLKTAKAIGLTIPPAFLTRADKIIQ